MHRDRGRKAPEPVDLRPSLSLASDAFFPTEPLA
jgi:hypothetical protein